MSTNQRTSQLHRKSILFIISRFNIGGPALHCSMLVQGLNDMIFRPKLLTGSISSHEGDMSYLMGGKNGHLIKVPELQREIDPCKDLIALFKIIRIIFTEKPDIVHTHMAKAGAISRAAVWIHNLVSKRKIKTVHTYHGNVLEGYFGHFKSKVFLGIEKALARTTDAIIAISRTQKWELTKKYKLPHPENVHIINLGFDLKPFMRKNGKGLLRSALNADDGTLLIGIVGRLVPIKNHRLFLDAAKMIHAKYPERSIRFVIVGDGELRDQLEQYTRHIGLGDYVTFHGWEKNIEKIYTDIDMLLLTSNNEGTPVSIIESMAASVPVVTTGVGGIKDLLGRIESGFLDNQDYNICERGILCPKGNAQAIANGVADLIENDHSERVKTARDFVFANYSDKPLIQRMERLYRDIINA